MSAYAYGYVYINKRGDFGSSTNSTICPNIWVGEVLLRRAAVLDRVDVATCKSHYWFAGPYLKSDEKYVLFST